MPAFLSLLVACKPPDPGVFIGTVGNLDSRIGVVTNLTKGRLYVGGGQDNLGRHHMFVDVKIDKNKLDGKVEQVDIVGTVPTGTTGTELPTKGFDYSIAAKGDSGAWRGTFVDNDNTGQSVVMFPPDLVDSGGTKTKLDGVYEAESDSVCPVGAIVAGDGTLLQGVYCSADGAYWPLVPAGGPEAEITDDGSGEIAVEVLTDPPTDPPLELTLTAVTL